MADDKSGRDDQAHDERNRQRLRDARESLRRGDEPEPDRDVESAPERRAEPPPEVPPAVLDGIERDLDAVSFPATGAELVAAVGDRSVEAGDRTYAVAELLPDAEVERFESPAAVKRRVQRPTVAAAMARVAEAAGDLPQTDRYGTRGDAYERTFRELRAVDGSDDDEGIRAVADWILERAGETGELPSSRSVRRRAAKYCRANGHEVRNDEWLGV